MSYDDDANRDRAREAIAAVVEPGDLESLRDVEPGKRSIRIDWEGLAAWERGEPGDYTLADVTGLASDAVARPKTTLDSFADALEHVAPGGDGRPLADVTPRLHNLPPETSFSVGSFSPAQQRQRLIELDGQVTKRTEIHPAIRVAVFRCTGCEQRERVPQPPFGNIRKPSGPCWDCKGQRRATWWLEEDASEWADHQKLRLQQPPEEALGETKHIDVHVFGDLAGREEVESGSRVQLTGRLVEVYTGEVAFGKRVVGNAITPDEEVFDDDDLAAYDDVIRRIREDPDRFEKLVASIAPGHEGDPLVKGALTVQVFTGGDKLYGPDGSEHRADSHVQLIGDPGTNKTGLLKAMYHRVPIGAFVDGPGSSGVGLTAAITKDDFSSEQWSIEAGALVRASGGTAFIDELDEFNGNDLSALHTPLESQEVLVTKAGKRATLTAETGVVAAANPTGGHYDPTKEFADQVDLQSPLLSRFDLIFVMREKVDEEKVRSVAQSMTDSRRRAALAERGELEEEEAGEAAPPYTDEEFRAYVAATQRLTPVPRDDAVAEAVIDWYTDLKTELPNRYRRAIGREEDAGSYPTDAPPLPVTARKVDAMWRLAAASARIRFSETIEMQDVRRVRPYLKRSLADIGIAPADNEAFDAVRSDLSPEEVGIG